MIKVKNLTKYFGENKVLDNVSFEIKPGEICGFIGENGAGKSTTMRVLSTLILDYEGEVFINGKELSKNIFSSRQIIGFMPDQLNYGKLG
ncbi:MAG: ATP-binding cassette domain-containing protein [Candidatus Gracilibacteria bacterium]|nr:ATP-binding cassette domain-containing protein [Candidatus Gracilibacteria bacterium]